MKTKMKRFTAAAAAKLKSRAGDTFVEVLAAGLIIVLGIAMAVAMIATSSRLVTNADKALKDYYGQRNSIENQAVGFVDAPYEIKVSMQVAGSDATIGTIPITVYTYKDDSNHPVLSYFVKR